jgi:hypothetical protein
VRTHADRTDAIGAIAQKQAKVVLLLDMGGTGLMLAEPALGCQMLEEGMQAVGLFMFALGNREAAGNRLLPVWRIGKARPAAGCFREDAGGLVLKQHLGSSGHAKDWLPQIN